MNIARLFLAVVFLISSAKMYGQEKPVPAVSEEELKRANDPMADIKAVNIQNYIVSRLYGTDAELNQLLLRYSQPLGRVLLRVTMPFVTSSGGIGKEPTSGLGDLNLFGIYSFSSNGNKIGIGPNLTIPTGTHGLGSGKWQAGISILAFMARSHVVQWGTLLQWQTSFAGDENRADISLLTPQVFFIWQIGSGFCLRSTGVWSFNLENGDYNVPIGLGVGKVVKAGKMVFNIFAEPQFTVLAEGIGQPKFQTFVGFNTQF